MSARDNRATRYNSDLWFNWNDFEFAAQPQRPSYSGTIFDETLRDGIQAPCVQNLTLAQKVDIVEHMVRCGIRSADLGFPGSDPDTSRECIDLAKHIVASGHPLRQGYAGRTHPADIHAICDIAQASGVLVDAYIFIGVSPIRHYVEDWDVSLIQTSIRKSVAETRDEGVEFVLVLEDTIRCTPEVLRQVYSVAIDMGSVG